LLDLNHLSQSMKKVILSIIPVVLILAASCGEKKSSVMPTPSVITNFEAHFGKELKASWKISGQSNYEASFNKDHHDIKAYFDKSGNWLKTESELSSSELPSVLVRTIAGAYKGNSISRVLVVEKSGEETTYRLFLKSGRQLSTVDLTTDGVILNNRIP
jgi:hypothetical protein